jgi:hypothetical protein
MSGNGNAVKKKTVEWLRLADDDLRLARHAFKLKSAAPFKLIIRALSKEGLKISLRSKS